MRVARVGGEGQWGGWGWPIGKGGRMEERRCSRCALLSRVGRLAQGGTGPRRLSWARVRGQCACDAQAEKTLQAEETLQAEKMLASAAHARLVSSNSNSRLTVG